MVIPNFEGRDLLGPCLASIDAAGGPDTEVIVVDNASRDGSPAWLAEHWPRVRVVTREANDGYAAACNAGVAVAQGEIVILLNNDVEVARGWSAALVDRLDASPDVAIAGGLTLYRDEPEVINTAGIAVAASLSGVDRALKRPRSLAPPEGDVAAVSGVSLAARRAWLISVGGLDEQFFMYYEDVELCLRAWMSGRRVRYVPSSVVFHAGSATAGSREDSKRHFQTTRNRMLTAAKLLEPREAARAWAFSTLSDCAAVAMHLLRGRFGLAAAAARAKARGLFSAVRTARTMDRTLDRRRSTSDLRKLGVIGSVSDALRLFGGLRAPSGPLDRR